MNRAFRHWAALLLALVPLVALAAGCTLHDYPQSSLNPQSDYAWSIQHLLEQLTFWVVVIFAFVQLLILYVVIRFRARPGAPMPKPVHGNTALEIAWTIAPAIILALVAVPTVMAIFKTQSKPAAGALQVKVIGHQWWWEFQYPELGVTTAGELHIPVHRPIAFDLETADVIHSFWFPAMGGKRDLIPSRTNHMGFTADSIGTFPGQCAELCGLSHANMRMKLMVETPADFETWVSGQKAPPAEPDSTSLAGHGKLEFANGVCITCHTIDGVSAGILGPNLTHFASRRTFAGSLFESNPHNLGRWLTAPQDQKPGVIMNWKTLGVTLAPEQVNALIAYLQSLK
ncbi:MAG: cytochrome c oxidase subunit II [Candidatus Eisenbacteria bacterium]|nr:cytochrome c oxidase subunit II [Candidatus Eisenbacteria bacterium]